LKALKYSAFFTEVINRIVLFRNE